MGKKSIKKNYIFNLIYEIFALITPLITAPYLARVLQSDGIGANSYCISLTSYFILAANLGFKIYAQREVAKVRDDKREYSRVFYEIMICKFLTTSLVTFVNILLCQLNVYSTYTSLMWILTINIVATFFDITFLFRGLEEFGKIVLRDIIIKVIGVALTFIFVKTKNDLWIYVLCHCLTTIVSALSLWPLLFKYLSRAKVNNPFKHLLPSMRLFIPTIAVSIYASIDKSLMGWLIPGTIEKTLADGTIEVIKIADIENGYYSQAESIVKMILTILTSLGLVVLPRNAYYFENGKETEAKENVYKSFSFTFMLGSALMFGIASISTNFVPWFFGGGYEKVSFLMMAFSPIVLSIGLNSIFGKQYLLAKGKDVPYTIFVIIAAAINICLNLVLIPLLYSFGALISTVFAETLIFVMEFIYLRKEFSFKRIIMLNLKYLLYGSIMFEIVFSLSYFVFKPGMWQTIVLVLIGIVVYSSLLLITKDKNLKSFLSFFKKFKKKNEISKEQNNE